jgi:hypothetical protein
MFHREYIVRVQDVDQLGQTLFRDGSNLVGHGFVGDAADMDERFPPVYCRGIARQGDNLDPILSPRRRVVADDNRGTALLDLTIPGRIEVDPVNLAPLH